MSLAGANEWAIQVDGELKPTNKDEVNPGFKKRYALNSVADDFRHQDRNAESLTQARPIQLLRVKSILQIETLYKTRSVVTLQGWPTQAGTHSNRGGGPFKPRWLICKQAIQVPGQGVWEELLSTFPSPVLAISCNNKLYFFYCLTFGLATALKVFASMMKLPISRLRFKSFNVLNYLDKLIIWGKLITEWTIFPRILKRLKYFFNSC